MKVTGIRLLGPGDDGVLDRLAPGVFDRRLDPRWTTEFLADHRHHLAVAVEDGIVVGMASAVHYVHPDKPPELWINEVGVAPDHRGSGLGRRLVERLLARGRELGCASAWTLTDEKNEAARALYRRAGGERTAPAPVVFEFDLAAGDGG